MVMGLAMLTKCAEVWVFGDNHTPGMRREIKKAKLKHIPIRYFDTDCQGGNRMNMNRESKIAYSRSCFDKTLDRTRNHDVGRRSSPASPSHHAHPRDCGGISAT